MKVSYKKIKCNKDWSRSVVDSYYDLRATDFLDNDELNEAHILAVLLRNKEKIDPTSLRMIALPEVYV